MGVYEAGLTIYYRMLLQGVEKLEVISIAIAKLFVMFDQPDKFIPGTDQALAKMVELNAIQAPAMRLFCPPVTRVPRSLSRWA